MKRTILINLLLCLARNLVFGQNWAPFNPYDKTVFSTTDSVRFSLPDSIQKTWKGSNLVLVRYDTVYTENDTIKYLCNSCQALVSQENDYGDHPKSGLFGHKVRKWGATYLFGPQQYSSNTLQYITTAEVGDTILKGISTCYGVVTGKTAVDSLGFTIDSLKSIQFRFASNSLTSYSILLSKRNGFLSFPSILSRSFSERIFTRHSDYNLDSRKIKSFSLISTKYHSGDQFSIIETYYAYCQSPFYLLADDTRYTNSVVLSCNQDSCLLRDTIREIRLVARKDTLLLQTRKIANRHSSHQRYNNFAVDFPVSSGNSDYHVYGFLRSDSTLFLGPTTGFFEGGSFDLLSTKYPIGYRLGRTGGALQSCDFSTYRSIPAYFSRVDTSIGALPNIHFPFHNFTSVKQRNKHLVNFFPNPATALVYPIGLTEEGILMLFNINGQKVLEQKIGPQNPVDISSLYAGLFFYRLEAGNQLYYGKIVKE